MHACVKRRNALSVDASALRRRHWKNDGVSGGRSFCPRTYNERYAVIVAIVDHLVLFRVIEQPYLASGHRNALVLNAIYAQWIRLQNDVQLGVVVINVPSFVNVWRDAAAWRNFRDQYAAEPRTFNARKSGKNDRAQLRNSVVRRIPNGIVRIIEF